MKLWQKIRKLFGLEQHECDAAQKKANEWRRRHQSLETRGSSGNPTPPPNKPTPILQLHPKQKKINVRL